MKTQLERLLEVQRLDLECDEIDDSVDAIDENLAEVSRVLEQLKKDLELQRQELTETEQLRDEKVAEHKEAEERLKSSKMRLTKVSTTKEYSAVELEIENHKRLISQLEEELVKLMEVIEATRASSTEKQEKIDDLSEQIGLEGSKAEGEKSALRKRLESLTKKRDKLAADIAKSVIRRYDFIRSRRGGKAIVAAADGYCQGCFMQLPPQAYIELQRGKRMLTCPSCQRILFMDEWFEDDAEEATGS